MIKKIIVLCLTCLMICSFGINRGVFAADSLIFDLDVSGYGTTGVTDRTGNVNVNVYSGSTTELKTIYGLYGVGKYLKLRQPGETAKTGVDIRDDKYRNLMEMSVEMWVNLENQPGRLMAMCPASFPNYSGLSSLDIYLHKVNQNRLDISYRPGRQSNQGDGYYNENNFATISSCIGRWTHFVITRKWTNFNESSRTGNCEYSVYINGVRSSEPALSGVAENVFFKPEDDGVLCFMGGLSAGSGACGSLATAKVYNKVLTGEEISEKYESEKENYVETAPDLKIESVSKEGGEISDVSDSITIQFNNVLDVETAQQAIRFTKADGTPIKGGAFLSFEPGYTKSATIHYGKLEDGCSYKLSVGSELMSLNGFSCEPFEREFTAHSEYIFYEDFMGTEYVVGEHPPTDKGIEYTTPAMTADGSVKEIKDNADNMMVCGDDSFKYVSMSGGGYINANSRIKVPFSTLMTDTFVADLKVRPSADEGVDNVAARELMITYSQLNIQTNVASMANGYVERSPDAPGKEKFVFSEGSTDENGFYDVRVIYEKGSNGLYTIKLQNINAPEDGESVIVPKTSITGISSIQLAHFYPQTAVQSTSVQADVAKIAMYRFTKPEILYTNIETLKREDDEFYIVFSEDMDEASFYENAIVLTDSNGKYVNVEFSRYDAEERRAYVNLNDYLMYETDYTLSVSGVRTQSGIPADFEEQSYRTTVGNISLLSCRFSDESGNKMENLISDESVYFSAEVKNNTEFSTECRLVLIMYDADGRIIGLRQSSSEQSQIDGNTTKTIRVKAEPGDIASDGMIRAFGWTEEQNGAISFMKPLSIGFANE